MQAVTSRKIVMVSGAPGSGKSTLARSLALHLGFALVSKDLIKETLFDALDGRSNDLEFSRQIGGAAMELLWMLAAQCPQVVVEANFRPKSQYERERLAALEGQIIEVYCWCPPEEAARRFARRAATPSHHAAHALASLSPELLAEYDQPIGVGVVIKIDTSRPPSIEEIVSSIEAAWANI